MIPSKTACSPSPATAPGPRPAVAGRGPDLSRAESPPCGNDASLTAEDITAIYEALGTDIEVKKRPEVINDSEEPLPDARLAIEYETATNLISKSSQEVAELQQGGQNFPLEQSQQIPQGPPAPLTNVAQMSDQNIGDGSRLDLGRVGQGQVGIEIGAAIPSASPVPIEARLVQDEHTMPVYDAVQVQGYCTTCWRRNQKYMCVGAFALVFGALLAVLAMHFGSQNDADGGESIDQSILQETTATTTFPTHSSASAGTSQSSTSTRTLALLYYADRDNMLCSNTQAQQSSNFRQKSYETVEECCDTEFWHLGGNECLMNSFGITLSTTTTTTSKTTNPQVVTTTSTTTSASTSTRDTTPLINLSTWNSIEWNTTTSTTTTAPKTTTKAFTGPTSSTTDFATLPPKPATSTSTTLSPTTSTSTTTFSKQDTLVWKQHGQTIIGGDRQSIQFGASVALSEDGSILAIGSMWDDDIDNLEGIVKVYESQKGFWHQIGETLVGEEVGDRFGRAVDLSADGHILAVGIPGPGHRIQRYMPGFTKVYQYQTAGSKWEMLGETSGEARGIMSGTSIALSANGKVLAVGAIGSDFGGDEAGHVRVFSFDEYSWDHREQLGVSIVGEQSYDYSGTSVSLSANGKTLAIGAPGNDGNGGRSGHVRIFSYGAEKGWEQLGQDIDGEASRYELGVSVALSADGSIIAVGAHGDCYDERNRPSYARVYHNVFDGSDDPTWTQIGQTIEGGTCKISVSLSAEGTSLAIGSPNDDGNGTESGKVRIFYLASSRWRQLGESIGGENPEDKSGMAIDLSADGSTVAIGSPRNDDNGYESGHVRVYRLE